MNAESIKACMLAVPEVVAWPEMAGVFEQAEGMPGLDWNLPVLACQAVGGDLALAIPGAAAIACLQSSIRLVDDMLDDDPHGQHLRLGNGPTANLALAFQAAAFRAIEQAAVDAEQRNAIIASLAWAALTTALAQQWDVQNPDSEGDYWRVVRAKSTPLYCAAFQIGALLGNASTEVAAGLRDFGLLFGEIVQIRDDLFDAFRMPADPDWTQGRHSLPILYARTARHPDRARFVDLLSRIDEPQVLREAQRILIRCGAVSYCAHHLITRYQAARQLLVSLSLADPATLTDLLAWQTQPVIKLLQASGADVPAELTEPPA